MNELKELKKLVDELSTTNSSNDKKEILKKYPQCQKILNYVYNPFKQYYVTSANLKKRSDLVRNDLDNISIFKMLDLLADRKMTGYNALELVNSFILNYKEYDELIYNIIDRNLKVRVDAKLINKVFPGCIPEFSVALANKYEDHLKKVDFKKDKWIASRKLDGVRCLAIIDDDGEVKLLSRSGKEFTTLGKIEQSLKKLEMRGTVFDGEICIVDREGNENFNEIMKYIKRKDYTIQFPRYCIFDMLPLENFYKKYFGLKFSDRQQHFTRIIEDFDERLTLVEQKLIKSEEDLTSFMDYAIKSGWEGLIIRKDVPYEGKRSSDMLKMKKFSDAEYVVKDIEFNTMRIIDKETGLEKEKELLASVIIEHKGYNVSVGSGFTLEERLHYYENTNDILGKTICVQYFEETTNKDNTISLRFPTVKHIYKEDRDV